MRRWLTFIGGALAAGLTGFCAAAPARTGAAPPRNVLVITLDTTRADHLSAYGGTAQVPNLERLAREGVRFDRAFAPAPITLPSHVSLFTGLYPSSHGVRENGTYQLLDGALTLAEVLHERGFATAAVVGSRVLSSDHGLDQGFDRYDDEMPAGTTTWAPLAERPAGEVADRGLAWLRDRDERPWFLWLHFFDPHWAYAPPEPYRTRYADAPYDGEIAYADEQIGRVFDFLRERGSIDRTLIVVAADHGESLGEHGESTHGLFVYDATVQVPLLLRHPDSLGSGRRFEEVVRLIDVFPTVLELVGASAGPAIDGQSLMPVVAGKDAPPRVAWLESWSPRLSFGWSELRAVRDRDWKYIQAPRPELYQLTTDPREVRNVVSERPERAAEYRSRLESTEIALAARGNEGMGRPRELDPATRRALESLGYVAGGGDDGAPGVREDPKDKVDVFERMTRALDLIGRELYVESVPLLRQLVAENPDSSYLYGHLGNALLGAGQRSEGIRALERTLQLDPSDFWTLNTLGAEYYAAGDLDQAAGSFRRALELNPRLGIAYHNLGLVEQQRGRPAEAMRFFEKALASEPGLVQSAISLGTLYDAAGRVEDALRLYESALQLDPGQESVFIRAAHLLYRVDRDQEALQVLARAQAAHPDSPVPALYRAAVYRKLGDDEAVVRELRAALAADPTNADARKGLAEMERKRREGATP